MADRLDISFNILTMCIRVIYTDLTRLNADVLVSSDDVHLSMAGGVGAAIRAASGDAPREDAQKHALPLTLGAVLPTTAGLLRAKYLFHTVTLDFAVRPQVDVLIPLVVRRVMELASALGARSIGLPLLGTGSAGMAKVPVLEHILRSLTCFAATHAGQPYDVTIALYASKAEDHAEAEQKLLAEIEPVRQLLLRWSETVTPINTRMALLTPLFMAAGDDSQLRQAVEARIAADTRELCRMFDCPEAQADGMVAGPSDLVDSRPEYERAKHRLVAHLEDLSEELEHLYGLQRTQKRRLRSLEQQWAQKGGDTPPDIINEIEDIRRSVEQREQRVQKITEQQEAAQRDLSMLERRQQTRASVDS
jgi:O-acetyl-ADP-ribose deacetylase (regulator of RNase III)